MKKQTFEILPLQGVYWKDKSMILQTLTDDLYGQIRTNTDSVSVRLCL